MVFCINLYIIHAFIFITASPIAWSTELHKQCPATIEWWRWWRPRFSHISYIHNHTWKMLQQNNVTRLEEYVVWKNCRFFMFEMEVNLESRKYFWNQQQTYHNRLQGDILMNNIHGNMKSWNDIFIQIKQIYFEIHSLSLDRFVGGFEILLNYFQ